MLAVSYEGKLDSRIANDKGNEIARRLEQYATKWNTDPSLLATNLNRIVNILGLLRLYSFYARLNERRGFEFTTKEWYWALEFYLQMDSTSIIDF